LRKLKIKMTYGFKPIKKRMKKIDLTKKRENELFALENSK